MTALRKKGDGSSGGGVAVSGAAGEAVSFRAGKSEGRLLGGRETGPFGLSVDCR
jgi:hypothetical protein